MTLTARHRDAPVIMRFLNKVKTLISLFLVREKKLLFLCVIFFEANLYVIWKWTFYMLCTRIRNYNCGEICGNGYIIKENWSSVLKQTQPISLGTVRNRSNSASTFRRCLKHAYMPEGSKVKTTIHIHWLSTNHMGIQPSQHRRRYSRDGKTTTDKNP